MKINTSLRKDDEVSYSTCGVLVSDSDNKNMISAERGLFTMNPEDEESQFLFYVSDEIPEE